jgi:hypothetical protein
MQKMRCANIIAAVIPVAVPKATLALWRITTMRLYTILLPINSRLVLTVILTMYAPL